MNPMNWLQIILVALLRVYKTVISPWLPPACRFEPSCSVFAMEAVQTHGALRGSWLSIKRLARCQPWCRGGFDPVPAPPNPDSHNGCLG